jgi:YD repeat-containing protein
MKILFRAFLFLFGVSSWAADYSYQYDAAGRLLSVSWPEAQSISYEYDAAGNILNSSFSLVADSDGDSLADAWERANFGGLGEGAGGDFDRDGFSNLNEFLAGTDPKSSASALRIVSIDPRNAGGTLLRVASVEGKRYQLQSKNSLSEANWTDRDVVAASGSSFDWLDTTGGTATRFYRALLVP